MYISTSLCSVFPFLSISFVLGHSFEEETQLPPIHLAVEVRKLKSLKCMLETMDRMRDVSGKRKRERKKKEEGKKGSAWSGVCEYNPF